MKLYRIFVFILFVSLLFSMQALANVSLKNGNFFIGYSDLLYPGGMEPKVERVYNSKSSHNGIFGYGWGSDYEVYLKISADGSVVIHENGGGAENRFTPPVISTTEIDTAINNIMAAKAKAFSSEATQAERERLRTDARYRTDEWERLYDAHAVQPRKIADGMVLKSNRYSYQVIKKVKEGYLRQFDNGQVQTFDNNGRLTRMADKNGNFIVLSYDKAGQLASIQDNFNRKITFQTNSSGKVTKVVGESNGKTAVYKYNGIELIYSKDGDGNAYEYRYSTNGHHNLVEIKYTDKTTQQIGYYPFDKCENVRWVKDRDSSVTEYNYTGECASGLEHATMLVVKGTDGKELSRSKYEYIEKVKPDGERYTAKLTSTIDGDKTETAYNESAGLPTEIIHNGEKTAFEYDNKGHVTKKTTPIEVAELSYDKTTSKVSKVVRYAPTDKAKKNARWAEYQYDDKGNLSYAKNSEGKGVKIVYDYHGRIKALVDQDKRRLEFTYNEASRPVEISDPAVGKISVQYSNAGDIKKVESSGGRKIALQVTSAFQNLLDIIRPAGVTLTF